MKRIKGNVDEWAYIHRVESVLRVYARLRDSDAIQGTLGRPPQLPPPARLGPRLEERTIFLIDIERALERLDFLSNRLVVICSVEGHSIRQAADLLNMRYKCVAEEKLFAALRFLSTQREITLYTGENNEGIDHDPVTIVIPTLHAVADNRRHQRRRPTHILY